MTKLPNVTEQDMATKLKKQKLFEMFPGIDPVALEEVFQANGYDFCALFNQLSEIVSYVRLNEEISFIFTGLNWLHQ